MVVFWGIAAACATLMYLLILGSSDPEMQEIEDLEQLEYLKRYAEKKAGRKEGGSDSPE